MAIWLLLPIFNFTGDTTCLTDVISFALDPSGTVTFPVAGGLLCHPAVTCSLLSM